MWWEHDNTKLANSQKNLSQKLLRYEMHAAEVNILLSLPQLGPILHCSLTSPLV